MIYNEQHPLKVICLCAGYGSQELALSRLEREFPGFKYEIARWSEFDPESTKPLDEQPAVIAYKALHPEAKDLNLGDMTKICWHKVKVEMATNTTLTFEEFFDKWCKEETNVTEVLNGGGYVYSGINYTTDENYHKCYTPIKEIDQMESGLDMLFYSTPCFIAGTLVMTDKGYKKIEDIVVGDLVYTHNKRYKKVLKIGKKPADKIVKVDYAFSNESIYCTPNHPFYVKNIETQEISWKAIGSLEIQDLIGVFTADNTIEFRGYSVVDTEKKEFVYNLEVEEDHSYTANGAIVHNCQSVSQAGLQHGFTKGSGTRSSIIWNVRDAIDVMRPKYACLENVRAMVSDKFISMFNLWRNELTKLNYTNFAKVLNAADYGVPQNRERIFLFSIYDPDHTASYFFPEPFKLEKTIDDILEKDVDEKYYLNVVKVSEFVKENKSKIEEYGRKAKGEIEKLPERLRKMIEKQEKEAEENRVIIEEAPILVKDENGNAVLDYNDEEQEISESFTEGDSATE